MLENIYLKIKVTQKMAQKGYNIYKTNPKVVDTKPTFSVITIM